MKGIIFFLLFPLILLADISLYWWQPYQATNFGDEISKVLIEKILNKKVKKANIGEHKLLAIGSILHFAKNKDIVWGSGINGKHLSIADYHFKKLNVRCVRGPLTRNFLRQMNIFVPKIYGDPALLIPLFFPEFRVNPIREYIVIPHISEMHFFYENKNVVLPTEHWYTIIQKIVESKLVISSSLHGIIVAEAFGIPARLLRITNNEPLFKYEDYYRGTGRSKFSYAQSIEEAVQMGGEAPAVCDLQKIINSFPFELFK